MPKPQADTNRMTHPAPEALLPHALGAADAAIARHVRDCPDCRAAVAGLRRSAEILQRGRVFDRPVATPDCLDEMTVAEFVDGRLDPEARAPVVAHLLTCARCRSMAVGTSRGVTEVRLAATRQWRRWSLPVGGAAAAAIVLLFLWPGGRLGDGGLREPAIPDTTVPLPIAPRNSVATADRFVWSRLSGVDRYRLRLYDAEGGVTWTKETADTEVARPNSVVLSPGVEYFWKVEAQIEWQRWVASQLVEFRLKGPGQ